MVCRNSKVRLILERKGQSVSLTPLIIGTGVQNTWGDPGAYTIIDCNAHWVTLRRSDKVVTHPLSVIELKMNDGKPNSGELALLLRAYY
jgi:hypothetical protein